MNIYHYDPISKEYTGLSEAKIDPLEKKLNNKEVFLIPANATKVSIPKISPNEKAVWGDENWKVVTINDADDTEKEIENKKETKALRMLEIDIQSVPIIRDWIVNQEVTTYNSLVELNIEYEKLEE